MNDDGTQKENPISMVSLPGVPNQRPNTSRGFSDPNGKYPKEKRLILRKLLRHA